MAISQNCKYLKQREYSVTQKNKTKNGENVPSLEIGEAVLVQCNLVDNQYQQKSEALYTFTLLTKQFSLFKNI